MVTIFWDIRGTVVFDFTPRDATVIAVSYRATLQRLRESIRRRRPGLLCYCTIRLGRILFTILLPCWTPDFGNLSLTHHTAPTLDCHVFGKVKKSKVGDFCLTTQSKPRSRSGFESRTRLSTARAWKISSYALASA